MALKDWKSTRLGKEHYVFVNKNGRKIYLAKQSYGDKWYVEFAWLYHTYKLFNTKSQAIAYAKNYMRSH